MAKLASKNQPEVKRNEASVAVTLYFKMAAPLHTSPTTTSLRCVKRREIMSRGETVV